MIQELGGHALAVTCDVRRNEDVRRALNATIETFGRLDFAFNNAGIGYTIQPLADVPEEEWDRILDIDLRGVFLCMKHELPLMLEQGGGAIINTSSGAGIRGFKGGGAYVAAKHGVVGLTKPAALDYAQSNTRINAVCPGLIDTPMMDRFSAATAEGREAVIAQEPVGRMGTPEEIAATVAVPGLGVRTTAGSTVKRYIFQAKVKRRSMRLTIGDVRTGASMKPKLKPVAYKS
jgi:NAD(P)-dependent dehydrogenase (short-subunit alcohol dehydrogenase family)